VPSPQIPQSLALQQGLVAFSTRDSDLMGESGADMEALRLIASSLVRYPLFEVSYMAHNSINDPSVSSLLVARHSSNVIFPFPSVSAISKSSLEVAARSIGVCEALSSELALAQGPVLQPPSQLHPNMLHFPCPQKGVHEVPSPHWPHGQVQQTAKADAAHAVTIVKITKNFIFADGS